MTYFENAAGIKDGAAVNLEGVTIGTVQKVTVVADASRKLTPIKVEMKLDGKFLPRAAQRTRRPRFRPWACWAIRWST